jgi:hypothetical protein
MSSRNFRSKLRTPLPRSADIPPERRRTNTLWRQGTRTQNTSPNQNPQAHIAIAILIFAVGRTPEAQSTGLFRNVLTVLTTDCGRRPPSFHQQPNVSGYGLLRKLLASESSPFQPFCASKVLTDLFIAELRGCTALGCTCAVPASALTISPTPNPRQTHHNKPLLSTRPIRQLIDLVSSESERTHSQ